MAAAGIPSAIPRRAGPGPAPLSSAQRRLWFLQQLFPSSIAYNVPIARRLTGPLDVDCLRRALREVLRRHHVLRTTVAIDAEGAPVQVVHPPTSRDLPVTPVAGGDPAERLALVRDLARQRARRPFDLVRGPLLRMELFELAGDDHVLLLCYHHMVADQWSLNVLFEELHALYAAHLRGAPSPLPEPALQYADYAAWQRARIDAGLLDEQLERWRRRLRDLPALALPTDRPRPAVQAFDGAQLRARVPSAVVGRLARLARERRTSLFTVVLAAFAGLVARCSGQDDLPLGIAVANRGRPEVERMLGFFVNTLVLRMDLAGDPRFLDVLDRAGRTSLEAYELQDVPFEHLVEALLPDRDLSQVPLVNVVLSYLNAPGGALQLPGLAVEELAFDPGIVKLDIDVAFTEVRGALAVEASYRTDLFERETVERLLRHLSTLLAAVAEAPALRLSEVPLVGPEEAGRLAAWSAIEAPARPGGTLHERFEEAALARPDAVAVACGDRRLTYGELDRRGNRVARQLQALGAGPESVVGLCARRSPEAVAGMLGVLKAGAAYLPLDPEHPPERLARLLADAGAGIVLTQRDLTHLLPGGRRAVTLEEAGDGCPESAVPGRTGPRGLAYVVYTSGSTGSPKGVMVEHVDAVWLCAWMRDRLGLGPGQATTWLGSPAFDISVLELWPCLLAGGRVEVLEDGRLEPEALRDQLLDRGVTVALLVTAHAEALLAVDWPRPSPLRLIATGGDRLHARPRPGLPFELLNMYGPTETTVVASLCPVATGRGRPPPIGRPIAGRRLHVLDGALGLVPEGVAGQLHVGGAGPARGYLGRPGQTAERFVPDPRGEPGGRMYRTGDLVRWRGGELEFLGRTDQQLKIRGHRVEPGEVEAALRAWPDVAQAAVAFVAGDPGRQDGRSWLVAYVAPAPGREVVPEALQAGLRRELPGYMVPEVIVILERLPLTSTGKLDRRLLPAPEPAGRADHVEPRDQVEAAVAEEWSRALGGVRVGARDSFFRLGGHSLLATRTVNRLRRGLGVEVSVRDLFDHPTVEGLAAVLRGRLGERPS
jgi:amino acid adenylation domain-containing protein